MFLSFLGESCFCLDIRKMNVTRNDSGAKKIYLSFTHQVIYACKGPALKSPNQQLLLVWWIQLILPRKMKSCHKISIFLTYFGMLAPMSILIAFLDSLGNFLSENVWFYVDRVKNFQNIITFLKLGVIC